ncbi:hypothetical protein APP_19000 [Aeribacillus pallidus]|nr:hypothetical protein APP_19000 [Aeribacillus pallidus]
MTIFTTSYNEKRINLTLRKERLILTSQFRYKTTHILNSIDKNYMMSKNMIGHHELI